MDILKDWIVNMFDDSISKNSVLFNLHHHHNHHEFSAHGLANEAVTILQTGSGTSAVNNNMTTSLVTGIVSSINSPILLNNNGNNSVQFDKDNVFEKGTVVQQTPRNFTSDIYKYFYGPKITPTRRISNADQTNELLPTQLDNNNERLVYVLLTSLFVSNFD
jgi:hypothetical protein